MKLYSREIGYPLTLSLCLLSSESRFASAREDAGAELVKKPNVLVIFADDVGTGDVPGYWDDSNKVDMPHLTKLVEHGTTFTDAHSSPLCAPSRYMFLSGNYQHRGVRYPSVWNLNYKTNQFKKGQLSIADVLGHNGYDTAMFGKWHLGGKVPVEDSFKSKKFYATRDDVLSAKGHDWAKPMEEGPWELGFKTSYITTGGVQSPPYVFFRNNTVDMDFDNLYYWKEGNYSAPGGTSSIKAGGEGTDEWDSTAYNKILVKETNAFLDENKKVDNPFFAYVALGAVHLPHSPPDTFEGQDVAGENPTAHMDVLYEMDKVVGSLIQSLDDRGLLKDTIVVFTSDNGGLNSTETFSDQHGHHSNGRLRGVKGEVYEGGIRVPMTFRWDGGNIPRNEKRSRLIGLNDLFKTICGLVGVTVPNGQAVDSLDFSDYIVDADKEENLREVQGAWVYEFSRLMREGLRFNEMKLVRDYQDDIVELYNLHSDPGERNDISKESPAMVKRMLAELAKIGPCYDRRGRFKVKTSSRKRLSRHISCYWIRQKRTSQRCQKFPEARDYCGLSCAGRNSQYCAVDVNSEEKMFKIYSNTY